MNLIKANNASAFMMINAILWGSSYIWSKILLGYLPYFTVLFLYFFGGLLLVSLIYYKRIRSINRGTVKIGIFIGCLSILSNIFCMLALKNTTSSNTAFIVQMSVVITPFLMAAADRKLPGSRTVTSAVTALAGLLLLTCDFRNFAFRAGDLFALANAIFFSLYLTALKIFTGKTDPVQFTFMQHVTGVFAFLGMALLFESGQIRHARLDSGVLAILAVSIAISVSTILIQSSAIKFIRPEKATVIYTLEPVAASFFAFVLVGEKPAGTAGFIGCALILLAVFLSVYKRRKITVRAASDKNSHSLGKDEIMAGEIGIHKLRIMR